ncbi:MAG TPA: helix-turn-helix domain-containing protein [Ktedonobacteraceae bacterium]|nr:helix-turn-helix domain-containing protein [Ktedonobacteraceae bacterium]
MVAIAGVRSKQSEKAVVKPLLLTIPQVMECLGLGYELIQKKQLPVKRFGRAVRVSYSDLQQWVEQYQ